MPNWVTQNKVWPSFFYIVGECWGETGCLASALLHHHTTGLETLTGLNKH